MTAHDQKLEREIALKNIFAQLCAQAASVVESETLEIKGWCANEKQLAEKAADSSLCLANASGGIVLLGIEEGDVGRRKFSKCPYPNVTREWIMQRVHDGTVPPVEVAVVDAGVLLQEVTDSPLLSCFALFVPKSRRVSGHQTVAGVSKIRSGKDCRPYYVAAEDDRTKAQVAFASLGSLSAPSINWGIQQYKKKFGSIGAEWETHADFLAQIGLLELLSENCDSDPATRIALAGVLLFGTEDALKRDCPGLETIVITPLGEKRLRTNIVETFRTLCGSRTSILPALCPEIPEDCLKEILMNCFVHRDYRTSSPTIIRVTEQALEFESPGGLCASLSPESLIYCTPVYRNFLLAEGSRYIGLCDKVGRGIDAVYKGILEQGLGFPVFDNGENRFTVRISVSGNRNFREFLKRRSQALTQLDEVIVLRFLFDRDFATFREVCAAMQRSHSYGHSVLAEMARKQMVEPFSSLNLEWKLAPVVRSDIEGIFRDDQFRLEFEDIFAEHGLDF